MGDFKMTSAELRAVVEERDGLKLVVELLTKELQQTRSDLDSMRDKATALVSRMVAEA